jgi:hypothetical protein
MRPIRESKIVPRGACTTATASSHRGLSAMPLVPQAKIALPQLPPELVVRAGLRADLDAGSSADACGCREPCHGL